MEHQFIELFVCGYIDRKTNTDVIWDEICRVLCPISDILELKQASNVCYIELRNGSLYIMDKDEYGKIFNLLKEKIINFKTYN